ncbi:Cysteine--tRNA ligase [Metamycoplasma arthritidis]|uniref:Cysteine--tRNA ligase n=1 Tax=Metamycoplasma arthritidis (strain 158L3-1) TaxID=243272 RepID=B3PM17_META1|nr:class I tRNA ligase family protein [Metamycoplasma arthritidis]ACF07069.1 cysteinyl-tRNA synthetase [Metamycoplasma arthritidis 158L3-1]VEU78597.1 Cysteine--tRNA ligase [Metamycoplasma arthritidis]
MKKYYYLCGPTVYNYPHIGNMRPIVTFDLMIRAQRYLGDEIFYLHNITDIDDKIINKSLEENKSEKEITSFYEKYYLNLFTLFNLEMPTKVIRVTDSLDDMYNYIQRLIDIKAAYQVGKNVFFDIEKYQNTYGSISNQKIANLNYDEDKFQKNNPFDFALWKETSKGIKFASPFGEGRPGWHTECSCFIDKYFEGKTIDIHAGGIDLIFPHHENENIQHFALHHQPIAKNWMHFGTLNYKNQKMSKSIGNLIYPHDFLEKYEADTYKLLMLTTNYAKPINLTDEMLVLNQNQINKFKVIASKCLLEKMHDSIDQEKVNHIIALIASLNFAKANEELIKLTKSKEKYTTFIAIMKILGFNFASKTITKEDEELYQQWKNEVANKNFEQADTLRAKLIKKGLI